MTPPPHPGKAGLSQDLAELRPVSFWGVCAGGGGDGAGQIHGVPQWDDAGESSVRAGGVRVCKRRIKGTSMCRGDTGSR